jgi:hypothetical protein
VQKALKENISCKFIVHYIHDIKTCITINIILKKEASVNHKNSYRKEIKCQTLARSTIIAAFSYMTGISKMSVAIYYFAKASSHGR